MEFIDVRKQLPEEHEESHNHMLWISTKEYGEMSGFYRNGKFMRDYACEILDVIAWLSLPHNENINRS